MARKQFLEDTLEKRKVDFDALASCEMIISGLQREIDITRTEYTRYRDNYQLAKISNALDVSKISNVSIIQPATLTPVPIKSKKRRNAALGVLLGLVGGIGLAYGREYLDDSIKTNEDVKKRLELPVLATIEYKKAK
jgi:uncharacterized protein involved in exopolysaccharide biosynthesis